MLETQINREQQATQDGIKRFQEIITRAKKHKEFSVTPLGRFFLRFSYQDLCDSWDLVIFGQGTHIEAREFLRQFNCEEMVILCLSLGVDAMTEKTPLASFIRHAATEVNKYWHYQQFKAFDKKTLEMWERTIRTKFREFQFRKTAEKVGVVLVDMSEELMISVGRLILVWLVEKTPLLEIQEERLAGDEFARPYLQANPEAIEMIEEMMEQMGSVRPLKRPCVVPPRSWHTVHHGGFHTHQINLIRGSHEQGLQIGQPCLDAINTLQETPWRINRFMVETMRKVKSLSVPLGSWPGVEPVIPVRYSDDMALSDNDKLEYKRKRYKLVEKRESIRGQRRAFITSLQEAITNQEFNELYFVVQLDFRGRAYYVSDSLNPQGDEYEKALLEFSKGQVLTNRGLYWLMIHLANEYGEVDKLPFQQRINWVIDNEARILSLGTDPFGDSFEWWQGADHPFMFAAACNAYKLAKQGEPVHLPVAVDGSCNALQHFAAIQRDQILAERVNVLPGETVRDIYSEVAAECNRILKELLEIENRNKDLTDQERFARLLTDKGGFDRKLAKRAVMTTGYGVTEFGIKQQFLELIQEGKRDSSPILDTDLDARLSSWLGSLVEQAIQVQAPSVKQLRDYVQQLIQCTKGLNKAVRWLTPVGFPVIQGYKDQDVKRVNLPSRALKFMPRLWYDNDQINMRKQVMGIAPNLVHSWDAAHMMLTVNHAGLESYSMVHDSFATLPNDLDHLNEVLRDQFVRLYAGDPVAHLTDSVRGLLNIACNDTNRILKDNLRHDVLVSLEAGIKPVKDIKKEIKAAGMETEAKEFLRLKTVLASLPVRPKTGTLNINHVTGSRYFFA